MMLFFSDPVQTPPTTACAFTQTPGVPEKCEHGQSYLRAQTSARSGGCSQDVGDTPNCAEVSASSASACL